MKLPYGISDFKALREQGNLYIDKTKYIERLENFSSKYMFFIRPRRFGKSLFLSTLEQYYDINNDDNFNKLFGDLYIGHNPTPLKNSYLVLRLNFSGLNTSTKDTLQNSFNTRMRINVSGFIKKYQNYFPETSKLINTVDTCNDAGTMIDLIINALAQTNKKLYLIIDEYDNFANDIIAIGDDELYKDIVRASGFVREFYKTVKIGTESVIDRIFITGISPVMLDDLTSGFNIAKNLTTSVALNEMLGFTQKELMQIIDTIDIGKTKQELVSELKKYYNGYLFNSEGNERVYNPDMILFFFSEWVDTGKYPQQLVDDNVKTDYGRLQRLVGNEENRKVLEEIIREDGISSDIATKFSFDRMYDNEYFVSLLFYMGLLTIKSRQHSVTQLTIPNYVIRTVFWDYFEKTLRLRFDVKYSKSDISKAVWQMGYEGKIEPFLDFVSDNILGALSNRDLIKFDEKYIKLVLFCSMALSDIYNPISERVIENGYMDIYLERDIRSQDAKYEWMIELKYLKESERNKLGQITEDGLEQIKRYSTSRSIAGRSDVKQVLIIFIGKGEHVVVEA